MLFVANNRLMILKTDLTDQRKSVDSSGHITVKLSWALAVSGDLDVDELGNSDNGDTGVQDDAEKVFKNCLFGEIPGNCQYLL